MRQRRPSYLYAIVAPELARVKIGVSSDPDKRLLHLQQQAPCVLGLHSEKWFGDAEAMEQATHQVLWEAHVMGEWYDMTNWKVDRWLAKREWEAELSFRIPKRFR